MMDTEGDLSGRERARLARARAKGYLHATGGSRERLIRAYSFWCWRLRIPVVWFERNTPRSRNGRLRLDLFTTANVLTVRGREELAGIAEGLAIRGRATLSPGDAVWEGVPAARA